MSEDNKNDFAAMLEASFQSQGRALKVGDRFEGEILSIGKEQVFVATGGPTDGSLPTQEILDENKLPKFRVGDRLEVVVVSVRGGEIRLRAKSAKGAADLESLEDAFDMELPVEGKVLESVKGGWRVQLMNKTAFCPISQMDHRPVTDPAVYVGQKYEFLITQFEEKGRNIVVSRRRILDMKRAEAEGELLEKLQVGDLIDGVVTRLDRIGAFVEIAPGVEGLVHISEIGWTRLQHASEALSEGQPVKVKVLKIDEDGDRLRISLSIKQGGGESDPWLSLTEKFPLGSVVEGTVAKKETFGLFVQIPGGFQGLLPRSKWRESTEAASFENKKRGEAIKVRIDEIRPEERRMTFGIPGGEDDGAWRDHLAASSRSAGAQSGFGSLGDLLKDVKVKR